MSVGVADRTLAQVIREVARLGGFLINQGTATAGTTTTLSDANNERTATADATAITGKYLYITGGTAAGQAREVTTYTLGVFTWIEAGTAPDTTSTWILLSVRPQAIIDAIDEVTRKGWRSQAFSYIFDGLVTNNLLDFYGSMEEWSAGTAVAPDGWTLGGASASVARNATTISQGLYSAALTAAAGAVGTLTRTIPMASISEHDGESLVLLGMVANSTAADAVVRVITTNSAGTATNTDRTSTYASNRWESLEDISSASIALPNPVIQVQVQLRTAVSTTSYFDDIVLYGPYLYDYDLPPTIIGLDPVIWMESDYRSQKFNFPLYYKADWVIRPRESNTTVARQIHFLKPLPSARHLKMQVYRAPDVQATSTSNVEPNPVWLAYAAAARLMEQEVRLDEHGIRRLSYLQNRMVQLEHSAEGNTTFGRPIAWVEPR